MEGGLCRAGRLGLQETGKGTAAENESWLLRLVRMGSLRSVPNRHLLV